LCPLFRGKLRRRKKKGGKEEEGKGGKEEHCEFLFSWSSYSSLCSWLQLCALCVKNLSHLQLSTFLAGKKLTLTIKTRGWLRLRKP
jgi:hypothetical protein